MTIITFTSALSLLNGEASARCLDLVSIWLTCCYFVSLTILSLKAAFTVTYTHSPRVVSPLFYKGANDEASDEKKSNCQMINDFCWIEANLARAMGIWPSTQPNPSNSGHTVGHSNGGEYDGPKKAFPLPPPKVSVELESIETATKDINQVKKNGDKPLGMRYSEYLQDIRTANKMMAETDNIRLAEIGLVAKMMTATKAALSLLRAEEKEDTMQ